MRLKLGFIMGIAFAGAVTATDCRADKVAAAVHILLDGAGNTRSALVAAAIGKNDATAAAITDGAGQVDVFAVGTGGTINADVDYLDNVTQDADRATPGGSLPAGSVVNFDATTATFTFDPGTNFTGDIVTDAKTTNPP